MYGTCIGRGGVAHEPSFRARSSLLLGVYFLFSSFFN
jgi:hypothetical protein